MAINGVVGKKLTKTVAKAAGAELDDAVKAGGKVHAKKAVERAAKTTKAAEKKYARAVDDFIDSRAGLDMKPKTGLNLGDNTRRQARRRGKISGDDMPIARPKAGPSAGTTGGAGSGYSKAERVRMNASSRNSGKAPRQKPILESNSPIDPKKKGGLFNADPVLGFFKDGYSGIKDTGKAFGRIQKEMGDEAKLFDTAKRSLKEVYTKDGSYDMKKIAGSYMVGAGAVRLATGGGLYKDGAGRTDIVGIPLI